MGMITTRWPIAALSSLLGPSSQRIILTERCLFGSESDATLSTSAWANMYKELKDYVSTHGHALVPTKFTANPPLGHWVDHQRYLYRLKRYGRSSPKNMLSDDKIEKLDALNFVWDVYDTQWEIRYKELQKFVLENGHANVPTDETSLGSWVSHQRHHYKQLQDKGPASSVMTQERIVKLEALGFVWKIYDLSWMERYQELVQYKHDHGDCLVPKDYASNHSLGRWVENQRHYYRKKTSITPERIQKLNDIEFIWEPLEYKWNLQYQELVDFVGSNGHAYPTMKNCSNKSLVRWMEKQRYQYRVWKKSDGKKKVALTEERRKKLEAV
eukprot:10994363-Ditylum_brightwellii.AAC.1